MAPRVVITGYGAVTPLGSNAEDSFNKASEGVSGISMIESFDTTGMPCRIGGEIKREPSLDIIGQSLPSNSKIDIRRLEKYTPRPIKFMIEATVEAITQAGLHGNVSIAPQRMGVALGYHGENPPVNDMMFVHKFYRPSKSSQPWDMKALANAGGYPYFSFFRRKSDVATAILGGIFDCKGPNISIASACAAGAQAIGEAASIIRDGAADIMIAGGCESSLNFTGFVGFVLIKAMSEKYSAPEKASRPFDRKRNGFVMSEGAGVVILEELEHARRRGAPIFAEFLGYGSSADAYRITDTHPKGEGAILAMRAALKDASLTTSDIDYINAHGTSTLMNDQTETEAIKQVFQERAAALYISSNKSMIGHTIAAAGAIECVLSTIGINKSIILPTINYENPDPKCNLNYVPNTAINCLHKRVLSNSFGFGGQNACLAIGKYD
ncbi:beta-ketoacyl-[acyl-carrier-protein] synthase family protein [Candidatus Magnetominusculus xianensis]|uniref:3-oxoacyl-ACP synthase n=1 Tax=Candidatus Magnetominusculus xianensis TaxID=1748249 RepID=A0ABR5SH38_9BACT|nr:beta-ketoacyl-[acyl-carrier-protein] synthase family protein [Candidatus Magnetominusculus xianensis]KWT91009.1 3-oxoacyl-ACP synthase [Candidatus Magnetominusculus xianensis]MBF0402598.1 beta-ketoacyl-[acyl-carrier-protein] synthase family protein [Nitrospirota bacterium]